MANINISQLTDDQKHALDLMMSGKNVFLTGEAGTGKSEVIKIFIELANEAGKQLLITAPTGTAAENLEGETIHRAFGAGIGVQKNSGSLRERKDVLRLADVIIIDEISMCRFDLFEYVARRIVFENEERAKDRYRKECGRALEDDEYPVKENDLQLIVIGDFYQLPPVITDRDREELENAYHYNFGKGYAFKSVFWQTMKFNSVILKEIVRQDDAAFKTVLSNIRKGNGLYESLDFLNRHSSKTPRTEDDAIFVFSTNAKCKERNSAELAALNTVGRTYEAEIDGDVKDAEMFAEKQLELKTGCKVMTVVNSYDGSYVNGTMGIVEKLGDDFVSVLTERGALVTIPKWTKEITEPKTTVTKKTVKRPVLNPDGTFKTDDNGNTVFEEVEEEEKTIVHTKVGSFTQFPLKVAYAITAHKSQGKTFSHVNLDPYAWDEGQFYTAVSRAKRIENMYFISPIQSRFIKTSKDVLEFMKKIENASDEINFEF